MKYEIKGDNLPIVICHLVEGESMITDSGAMSWMEPGVEEYQKLLVECLVVKQYSKTVIQLQMME